MCEKGKKYKQEYKKIQKKYMKWSKKHNQKETDTEQICGMRGKRYIQKERWTQHQMHEIRGYM